MYRLRASDRSRLAFDTQLAVKTDVQTSNGTPVHQLPRALLRRKTGCGPGSRDLRQLACDPLLSNLKSPAWRRSLNPRYFRRPSERPAIYRAGPLAPTDAADMLKRRLKQAGLPAHYHYSPHSFRATGITNFLENDGTLEAAQRIAGHADSRTTKLYDRRGQKVLLEDMERIRY